MTALSTKQRAQVNAALSLVHANGYDVSAAQRHAKSLIAAGHLTMKAYDVALERAAEGNPELGATMKRVVTLIGASDTNTVARYDQALRAYIQTGDQRHVDALEPMMRQDTVAMAVRSGELTADDAAGGKVDWNSLGFAAPAGETQQFAFKSGTESSTTAQPESGGETNHRTAPAQPFTNQFSFAASPTGVRTADTAARWEKGAAMPRYGDASPHAGMAPAQIREAMRAENAAPRGWIDRADES